MNRRFDKDGFPKVPETVHRAVLDAFDRLEEKPANVARMPSRRSAAGMLRVAMVAVCIFVLGIAIGVATAPAGPVYDFEMILDVTDRHIWTYDGETVEVLTLDEKRVSKFDVSGMTHMAAVEETLIGNSGQWIHQYDMDGNVMGSWKFDAENVRWKLKADEDFIYLLACEKEYDQRDAGKTEARLYRLARAAGSIECMDADGMYTNLDINQGTVYAYSDPAIGDALMRIFEPDGSVRVLEEMPTFDEFAVDPSGSYALVRADGNRKINCVSMEDGGLSLAKQLEQRAYAYTLFEANGMGIYTMGHGRELGQYDVNELIFVPWDELLPGAEVTEQLTVVNVRSSDRLTKAIEMFNERYPHIRIVQVSNSSDHQLMADIMAGKGNADIVFSQINGGADPQLMAKAGAVVNLAEYDEFMENLAQWYDVSGLVGSDDYVYCVAESSRIYSWSYNATILNAVGIPLPQENWIWDDFFEIGRKIAQYNQENGKNYKLLGENGTPYLVLQYHNNTMKLLEGTASYDNETFRSLISQWKEMEQLGLVGRSGTGAFNVNSSGMAYSGLLQNQLIYPPVVDENTRWPVNTITGVVNANCENIEAAVYFMTCFISPEAMTTGQFASSGKLIADDSLYPEGSLEPDSYRHTPTAENAAYWQRMIENGVAELMYNDVLRTFVKELYPQYLNDEIDLDTMLRMLQQRADMMLGE